MSPQVYGYLYERLFTVGALDVWTTPIVMKKTRPAAMLSVLCRTGSKDACASAGVSLKQVEEAARLALAALACDGLRESKS